MDKPGRGREPERRGIKVQHPLEIRILAACNQGEVTPKDIARRENMRLDTVGKHFRRLERAGYLRVSRTERARGFLRNYYVADRQKIITDEEFERMSPERRRALSEAVLRDFQIGYAEARDAGLLDAGSDQYFAWILVFLDEQAWSELKSELARVLELSLRVQAECKVRLRRDKGKPIQTVLALAGFEAAAPGPAAEIGETSDFEAGCGRALETGAFDARHDSHLSWSPMPLDEKGRAELRGELPRLAERALELREEARARMRESGEEPVPTMLGLAVFQGVPKPGAAGSCP